MDVTIYYTPESEENPGIVERYTTAPTIEADHWKVGFFQDEKSPEWWGLKMTKHTYKKNREGKAELDANRRKQWYWSTEKWLLERKAGSMGAYVDWIKINVSRIDIDGITFWQNPEELEDEGGAGYE